jgi:non-specific serine/threonine protein kinase
MPLGTLALDRGALDEARRLLRDGLTGYIEAKVETAFPLALEQFAALAAARGQAERALRLAGAGAAWRRRLATYPTPYTAWLERYLSVAQLQLPRAQAEAAWEAGEAMSLEHAVAYALADEATA